MGQGSSPKEESGISETASTGLGINQMCLIRVSALFGFGRGAFHFSTPSANAQRKTSPPSNNAIHVSRARLATVIGPLQPIRPDCLSRH